MDRAWFLLRPRWLLSHLLILALLVTTVNLGFWQLRRLDERRERNELIESRLEQAPVQVEELLSVGDDAASVDDVRFRPVTVTGSYRPDETVPVRNRSQDGAAGGWLVTPIELAGGDRAGVIRGFVGFGPDGDIQSPAPPDGRVTVRGVVVDPERLDGTAAGELAPLVAEADVLPGLVLASESEPPEPAAAGPADATGVPDEVIVPVAPPELSEGPHLSYAVQWFIFTVIGAAGYPLVLRRVVIRRGKEVDDPEQPGDVDADDLDRELEELLRSGP